MNVRDLIRQEREQASQELARIEARFSADPYGATLEARQSQHAPRQIVRHRRHRSSTAYVTAGPVVALPDELRDLEADEDS